MKISLCARLIIPAILTTLCGNLLAENEIQLGDTRDQVIAVLGHPKGTMKSGTSEYLSYPRGIVRVTDGKVTLIKLESKEEMERKEAERQALEAERRLQEQAEARARDKRINEGNAIKQKKLGDRRFRALPDEEKLKFWESFQKQYPEVSVESEISALSRNVEPATEPEPETKPEKTAPDKAEQSEREQILETINDKQMELDALIEKAKTTSAGRTFRLHYLQDRKRLEDELTELRTRLKTLPKEAGNK